MYRLAATRTFTRTVAVAPRQRGFHLSIPAQETMTEKAKKVASDVNIKVGQTLASGIETGEKATEKTKETIGYQAEEAKGKAKDTAETAQHKANKAATGAQEAKEDFKKEVRK